MGEPDVSQGTSDVVEAANDLTWPIVISAIRRHLILLVAGPLSVGLIALGATYLMAPVFTAVTTFMPPQQQGGAIASPALASLGALGGLAAGVAGVPTPADRYVSLMQSVTVADRIIQQFGLMQVYRAEMRVDARKILSGNVKIGVGKKDGLITVEVEDTDPKRAAAIANRYVDELRRLTGSLAVTEAQQRRVFFDQLLVKVRDQLTRAQEALQASGFSAGALKAEPQAVAEAYARLRAEMTLAEVKLQAMRGSLADDAPEVRSQRATLDALKAQIAHAAQPTDIKNDPDFIGRYREFKYQAALFELYSRQLEAARADEAREGALIQVVDPATAPERRTRPKRALTAVLATLLAFVTLTLAVILSTWWRQGRREPDQRVHPA